MVEIYFAGPINARYWRNDVLGFNPLEGLNKDLYADGYKYAGPKIAVKISERVKRHDDLVFFDDGTLDIKEELFERCIRDIDSADGVFAWIDNENRHGTLAEIMYAFSKGLYIYVVISPSVETEELWFPLEAADVVVTTNNIRSAWQGFIENSPFKERLEITEKQVYLLSLELSKHKLELIPDSFNKYEARKLIGALVSSSSGLDKMLLQHIEDKKVRYKNSNAVNEIKKMKIEPRTQRLLTPEQAEIERLTIERIRKENMERAEQSRVKKEKKAAALRYNLKHIGLQKLVCEGLGERITEKLLLKAIETLKIRRNSKYYNARKQCYTDEAVVPLVAYFKEQKSGK
ncbi:hypothetical protein H7992_04095 [Sporosarcina sp. resist]|uniref:hypothetical protein n=1 Tax=Sporosarcina sp. resist TaxID=2762563 RepID=UPI00164DEE9C|nr:hypothetical protein [Sporosarcina sp. resist]QNK88920.1 hypothetical protein H7992_04095 [Sporosarcina sp. resist]